jgi:DNA-binding NarL/FixJ family response regulator
VLLIDPDISDYRSVEPLKRILQASPDIRIVIFTENRDKSQFLIAMQIGVRGYLSKDVPVDELIASLSLIARGEVVISPVFSREFFFSAFHREKGSVRLTERTNLSDREIEVLRLVTGGATNREIAGQLFITENTVKVHLKNILEKLQLRNRQQLAVYAVRQGISTAST